jgi:hypothetical protein
MSLEAKPPRKLQPEPGALPSSQSSRQVERRALPRLDGREISAFVRLKGSFSRLSVEVLDFNRHGAAIHLHIPLPREQVIFLTLKHGSTQLERIIGVVHNCLDLESGYRCGIRFRTQSELQFDKTVIENQLATLERQLVESA